MKYRAFLILAISIATFGCIGPFASADSIVHGPFLQWSDDPCTTVTITWIERSTPPSDAAADELAPEETFQLLESGPITVRRDGDSMRRTRIVHSTRFADSYSTLHRVHVTALSPDTRYRFTMPEGASGIDQNEFVFQTAPAELREGETIAFVTGGDMFHTRDLLDAMNQRAGREDPLFALLGGDLAYANGKEENRWYQWIDSWAENAVAPDGRLVPMIVAIGNHETGSELDPNVARSLGVHPHAKYFFALFRLPDGRTNYAVDFGDWMSIILLDSDESQSVAAQSPWLRQSLMERVDRRYIFACYHKPAFGANVKEDIESIKREWAPLFEEFHVNTVFENDHHVYARSAPLRNGRVDEERGVMYVGGGAWGVKVREIPDYSDKPWIVSAQSENHLIRVDVSRDTLQFNAKRADGSIIDSYSRLPIPRESQSD